MPSYISSSDRHSYGRSWAAAWFCAVGLVVVSLGAWEATWRSAGFGTVAEPDASNWAILRYNARDDRTVFVGTSRIQAALDPRVWSETLGGAAPLQLAIQGGRALPVLEHLAVDDQFAGTVVVDITLSTEFDIATADSLDPELRASYEAIRVSPGRRLEAALRRRAGHFVFRRATFSTTRWIERIKGAIRSRTLVDFMPKRSMWNRRSDRFTPLDFTAIDAKARTTRIAESLQEKVVPARDSELHRVFKRFRTAVRGIRERGGEVVFVVMPHGGRVAAFEKEMFPDEHYWETLEKMFGGRTVHYEDYEALRSFHCPDGSHLDATDSARFTAALALIVSGLLSSDVS